MNFYAKNIAETVKFFSSDTENGLAENQIVLSKEKYGENVLSKKKKNSLLSKIFSALKEPMLIILLFSFIIAFGTGLGELFKIGSFDFTESLGILLAIVLSVSITLIMEGSSEKAFNTLNNIYVDVTVKTIREGKIIYIRQRELVCGDIVFLESGDKIVADGRLISSNCLTVDESALTGESRPSQKDASCICKINSPLAERLNCVYSGTFVSGGNGVMIVTSVGDNTEIGNIASELKNNKEIKSPLSEKLEKLGKIVTIIGVVTALSVFIISIIRLSLTGNLSFNSAQSLFISCIILIVAAVPEGLPTIVAVSLALNMIKLAKQNALIKKMVATETAGAVSVICSDKTGTLTKNKMSVISICSSEFCVSPNKKIKEELLQNFICNSTAEVLYRGKEEIYRGSGTECALISAVKKYDKRFDYKEYRKNFEITRREPFSSDKKYMITVIKTKNGERELIKGAPEKVLSFCNLSTEQINKQLIMMREFQKQSKRIICFAHKDGDFGYIYDGYCALADEIRPEVFKAVKDCKRAGISVKMLTGDNSITAYSIAKELEIIDGEHQVINASEIEKMSDEEVKKILPKITVIARSTPIIKLRIVKILKSMGEVVAVTGDGINDAPAIRHADVGFAMGKSGSEISKEAADAVLLDDSFATVVKTISFGRNVYRNIQRFIIFQLSVNLSALLLVTVCAILGLKAPFNTLQLLWINVIMDGPPALTLGLEAMNDRLMEIKPVRRDKSIITFKMLMKILFNGIFIGTIIILQYLFNFLSVSETEKSATVFTLFIIFQLFNAFNCRELGAESIFKGIGKNKIMAITFLATFLFQIIIVCFFGKVFGIAPLSFSSWIKIIFLGSSILIVTELYKLIYRNIKKIKVNRLIKIKFEQKISFDK